MATGPQQAYDAALNWWTEAMGHCKDCKHWRLGTWHIYSDDQRVWKSVSAEFNMTDAVGYCVRIKEGEPGSDMAAAVVGGYSDPFLEHFYTMSEFGCELFEQYEDKSIQEGTENHNMEGRGPLRITPGPDPALEGLWYNPETCSWEKPKLIKDK